MNDTGVIDQFLSVFTSYIDSGFGLLGGEVGFLSSTLIAIDVTIAALFWAWGADEDILQRLVRKTLYIGTFAFIIGNFSNLATILFESFAGLGLQASGSGMAIGDFLKPGFVAATGLDAGKPLLDATADLLGPVGLFTNFVQIAILLIAWLIVVLAFFILSIQVFVTIIEFKLVTLAGFVLLPFAFFGRTAFMAERVLGHVISSGIKLLVLAVITGIGTTLFARFTSAGLGAEPTLEEVMAIALAALTLLGLGIFGPGLANGIVSGGPQLGAGSAAGTAVAAGATLAGGVAGAHLPAGAAGNALSGAAAGGARAAGAAAQAYSAGASGKSGMAAVAAGTAEVARSAAATMSSPLRAKASSIQKNFAEGRGEQGREAGSPSPEHSGALPWAAAMKRRQMMSQSTAIASQTLKSGDSHGGGGGPDITDRS
ncbi:P-type conjugative transfer protein TrbL [Sphingobium sp. BS19]|uniref:P-type conjugative transfer protein TrbL n=1 Tax=Sphingobium sp. BS19 TaxID=3018973 RepID=UPI0022EE79DA|nr:P-type conjugative transfer protein TrbL [Sphingobium sp. BS19]GLI98026.1 conjugal transfer protein TrbL [Sphingobium sp. BS19]